MEQWVMSHLVSLVLALGGAGIIVGYAIKGIDGALEWMFGLILAHPKSAQFVVAYRVQIEAILDEIDRKSKEIIDEAAKNNAPQTDQKAG